MDFIWLLILLGRMILSPALAGRSGCISQTSGFFPDLEQGHFSSSHHSAPLDKRKGDVGALFHPLLILPGWPTGSPVLATSCPVYLYCGDHGWEEAPAALRPSSSRAHQQERGERVLLQPPGRWLAEGGSYSSKTGGPPSR